MPNQAFSPTRASHADLRDAERVEFAASVRVRQTGAKSIPVIIEDVSRSGCRVQWPHILHTGDRVWITFPGLTAIPSLVVWTADFRFGCRFEVQLHPAIFKQLVTRSNA